MTEFLSSRSRREDTQRCPRARWWLHEAQGTGLELVRQAVPLVTGASVHAGLAALLKARVGDPPIATSGMMNVAVDLALMAYDSACKDRGFDLGELEDQSYVYQEQRALVEALVRLAGLRVIPALLDSYEVLEVERMDKVVLHTASEMIVPSVQCPACGYAVDFLDGVPLEGQKFGCPYCGGGTVVLPFGHSEPEWTITWRSIPDALLRHRESHELYVLSWKTIGEYGARVDDAARVDMQGVSEMWALGERLRGYDAGYPEAGIVPDWYVDQRAEGWPTTIRGVQMVYLVKGQRRKGSKELTAAVAAGSGVPTAEVYKTASPLIYGYVDKSFPPKLAWAGDWRCSAPHAMRKSQWYPAGECPGDGRLHRRGDDWQSVPMWHGMGVRAWMDELAAGRVTPEAGDCLDQQWAMPVPYFRTQGQVESWLRQTRAAERRVAEGLLQARPADRNPDALLRILDEEFPQHTAMCANWFGRKCPAWELCHGPDHVASDPLGSGLYQVKTPYEPGPGGGE